MRAQTEREILSLLDHPFLPTLYSHFETEKFSCLLMEFCSGGDLHLLRQRQPGKHFSEQAARLAFDCVSFDVFPVSGVWMLRNLFFFFFFMEMVPLCLRMRFSFLYLQSVKWCVMSIKMFSLFGKPLLADWVRW